MEGSKHQNGDEGECIRDEGSYYNFKKTRKLQKPKRNVKPKDEKNVSSKKWKCLDSLEDDKGEKLASILLSWGRERGFYFLGLFCLLMCAVLFALQAYMAFRSYQMLHQITTKRHIPETVYQIYFDGHDWALDLDKVDLRANTSLFIH